MKPWSFILLVIGIFVFPVLWRTAVANTNSTLSQEVSFTLSDLSITKKGIYDVVKLPETFSTSDVGKPELPVKVIRFATPPNTTVQSVYVIKDNSINVPGTFYIYPKQQPQSENAHLVFTPPDPVAYSSAFGYPSQEVLLVGNNIVRGVNIATILVYPLEYIPAQKQLILHDLTVQVTTTASNLQNLGVLHSALQKIHMSPKGFEASQKWFNKFVVNPQDAMVQVAPAGTAASKAVSQATANTTVDYLIITNHALKTSGAFQPLIDSKTAQGLSGAIVTIEDDICQNGIVSVPKNTCTVGSTVTPLDQMIRAYITNEYTNNGLTWVLLGGDASVIPPHYMLAKQCSTGGPYALLLQRISAAAIVIYKSVSQRICTIPP